MQRSPLSTTSGYKILSVSRKVSFALFFFCAYLLVRGLGVIRLSLGKLVVNLSQVVKRTNTPLIP